MTFHRMTAFFGICILLSVSAVAQVWSHTWGGSADDVSNSLAFDATRSALYAAGTTSSFGAGGNDVVLTRFTSDGTQQWARTWGGPGDDQAFGVAIDRWSGDVYVAGETASFGHGSKDAFLLKFDSNGRLHWARTWGTSATEAANAVVVGPARNIYIVGQSGNNAALVKFTPGGQLLWSRSWQGHDASSIAYGASIDRDGNILVTGTNVGPSSPDKSLLVLKYDHEGSLLWSRQWSTTGGSYVGKSITTDARGQIYVTGYSIASPFSSCDAPNCESAVFTAKLSSSGTRLWAKGWKISPRRDFGTDITLDRSGNVLLTGVYDQGREEEGALLVEYDNNGNRITSEIWLTSPFLGGRFGYTGLALDGAQNVFLGGYGTHPNGSYWFQAGIEVMVDPTSVIAAGNTGKIRGTVTTPHGLVTTPTGVLDNGAGGTDLFLQKHSPM